MHTLDVEADDMAHLDAVLEGALLPELVVRAKLREVKLHTPVVRHLCLLFSVVLALGFIGFKTGGDEFKSEQLADAFRCVRRQRYAGQLLPQT